MDTNRIARAAPALTGTAFIVAVFVSLWIANADEWDDAPPPPTASAPANTGS